MSLTVVVNGPEGVVLAADTRVTVPFQHPRGDPAVASFDGATKILHFGEEHAWVGAVTYGLATIGGRTAHSLIPEFELQLDSGQAEYSVAEYASLLSEFFLSRWSESGLPRDLPPGGGMTFMVAGFDASKPYGEVWIFTIPGDPHPQVRPHFHASWGGITDITNRIINGVDPRMIRTLQRRFNLTDEQRDELERDLQGQFRLALSVENLPLQECVDLAIFIIRTTITAQALAVMERGVGGIIEVATITRTEGFRWVQRKEIHGERGV